MKLGPAISDVFHRVKPFVQSIGLVTNLPECLFDSVLFRAKGLMYVRQRTSSPLLAKYFALIVKTLPMTSFEHAIQ
jgi:hypothetical protein